MDKGALRRRVLFYTLVVVLVSMLPVSGCLLAQDEDYSAQMRISAENIPCLKYEEDRRIGEEEAVEIATQTAIKKYDDFSSFDFSDVVWSKKWGWFVLFDNRDEPYTFGADCLVLVKCDGTAEVIPSH